MLQYRAGVGELSLSIVLAVGATWSLTQPLSPATVAWDGRRQQVDKGLPLCSDESLFTKIKVGQIWSTGHSLPTIDGGESVC